MTDKSIRVLNLGDVRIGFKNFSGREGKFNAEGDRNFVVFLDFDKAQELASLGWNVKFPDQPEQDDSGEIVREPYLPVSVSYKHQPPTVYLVDVENNHKTVLDEATVNLADSTTIVTSDLIINASHWSVNGNSGIKAYLKTAYLNIEPSPFFAKYGF